MGAINSHLRSITKRELNALTSGEWYRIECAKLSDLRALEFEISIDSVVKYRCDGLSDAMQLHVLHVSSIRLGFETCFMDHAAAAGSFPGDLVRVAFAVRPSSEVDGDWEDASGTNWAIAFSWLGKPIEIVDSDQSDRIAFDDILPIYRLWAMQQAEVLSKAAEI